MTARVLVVGAGSIGSRHAKNLVAAGATVTVIDPAPGRAEGLGIGTPVHFDLGIAGDHDAVVLASPTIHHGEQLEQVLSSGARVLVEKPMVATVDELAVVDGHEDRVMVGFNLRFHRPIERLRRLLERGVCGSPVGGRFWFGSWLPDWRPGTDYRTSYSARADLGGGVLLDAIHEIDLAVWFFGPELDVAGAIVERVGPLEIDVEDTVRALLRTPTSVPVEISLDLLSRRYRRGIEIIGTDATLRYDWDRLAIEIDRAGEREVHDAREPLAEAYVRQTRWFLEWVAGGDLPPVDGRVGADSVRLAQGIREAAWASRR